MLGLAARTSALLLGLALSTIACDGCGGVVRTADATADASRGRDGSFDAAGERSVEDRAGADVVVLDHAYTDALHQDRYGRERAAADQAGQDLERQDRRGADHPGADHPVLDAVPDTGERHDHVEIYVDNFCNLSVAPGSCDVSAGQTLQLSYHNNSVDYEVDVWLSYGGGYLELAQGAIWDDGFLFCTGSSSYTAYADISIAGLGVNDPYCPGHRLLIHCL